MVCKIEGQDTGLKFLALKKCFFSHKKYFPIFFWLFCLTFSVQLFRVDPKIFSKFFWIIVLSIKQASKVAHNRPKPFYFTVQPRPFCIMFNAITKATPSFEKVKSLRLDDFLVCTCKPLVLSFLVEQGGWLIIIIKNHKFDYKSLRYKPNLQYSFCGHSTLAYYKDYHF